MKKKRSVPSVSGTFKGRDVHRFRHQRVRAGAVGGSGLENCCGGRGSGWFRRGGLEGSEGGSDCLESVRGREGSVHGLEFLVRGLSWGGGVGGGGGWGGGGGVVVGLICELCSRSHQDGRCVKFLESSGDGR